MTGLETNVSRRHNRDESAHMPIPLYGFLEGDTLGLVVLAEGGETIRELAQRLQDAASIRVAPNNGVELIHNGKTIDLDLTVAQAGLEELDRFDVTRGRKP